MDLSTEQTRRRFITTMFHDMSLDGFTVDPGFAALYDCFICGATTLDETDALAAEWIAAGLDLCTS